jgi:hypothetical protein
MTPGRLKEVTKVGNIDLPKGTIVKSVTQKKMGNSECDEWEIELNVCMPWSTREFLDMAEKVRMLWRKQPIIPTRSLRVIVNALELGIHEFDKKWDRSVEMLAKRAALLAMKEEKARQGLHPAVQRVSCSKRTKFMEELLQNIEHRKPYPDIAVTACIREGFPLVGDMPETGVFQKKPEDEVEFGADPEWLQHLAPDLRQELIYSLIEGEPSEVDHEVYRLTCGTVEGGNEIERGWAEGPFTEDQITEIIGDDKWVAARRFGAPQ